MLRRNSIQGLFKGYYYDKNNHQVATPSTKQNSVVVDSVSKEIKGDVMGEDGDDFEMGNNGDENVDDEEADGSVDGGDANGVDE